MHTSVAADKRDFEEYLVEDSLHIAINLKDFKAVVAHAETANTTVTARYTRPCKPLQLAYEFEGVSAEFTIMTRGEADTEDAPPSSRATVPQLSRRTPAPTPTPAPVAVSRNDSFRTLTQNTSMPPPLSRSRSIRPLNGSSTQQHLSQMSALERPPEPAVSESMEFDSLFVPQDDDRQWDEMNDEEEPQDILGWDATGGQVCFCLILMVRMYLVNAKQIRIRSKGHSVMQSRISLRPSYRANRRYRRMIWVSHQHNGCHRYFDLLFFPSVWLVGHSSNKYRSEGSVSSTNLVMQISST